ncbi:hypothetical protein BZK37_03325, partial [Enterococcus casseliflavus]
EDGKWTPTTPTPDVSVDPDSGVVTIPENKVKDNTPVKSTAEDKSGNPSTEAQDTAKPKPAPADTTPPSPPTVVAKEDGSVTVTPPTEPDTSAFVNEHKNKDSNHINQLPQTGDTTNVAGVFGGLVVSLGAMLALFRKKRS